MAKITDKDAFRFWKHVQVSTPDVCWPWKGKAKARGGYGAFRLDGKTLKAHRLAYELTHGPIPQGLQVLHRCVGNPACCNPNCLYLGTDANNAFDRVQQGRQARGAEHGARVAANCRRGETHRWCKLTDSQIDEMRSRYAAGGISQSALGAEYDIHQGSVSQIVNHVRRQAALN